MDNTPELICYQALALILLGRMQSKRGQGSSGVMGRRGSSGVMGCRGRYACYFVLLAIVKLRRKSKRSKHRRYVLEEWLKTERSYGVDLGLAVRQVKGPLVAGGLVDKEGVGVLCPQFEQMLALSEMMAATVGVVEREKNMNRIVIGPELIKFANFYKLYGTYFGNRMRSQRLLKQLFETEGVAMRGIELRLREAAGTLDRRKQAMTISSCLEQPQYRMFKYVLLLKEYVRKMPVGHPDFGNIRRAQGVFEDINRQNNELMGSLEAQEQKVKLNRLFGKSIDDSSQYLVQMAAETLYFPVKLYIFNNLVIVAAVENYLGFQQERRYLNLYLNEFSCVAPKPDNKYFTNAAMLCGQYDALHLFSEHPGSQQEIVSFLNRVIAKLQANAAARRIKQKDTGGGKLSFALDVGRKTVFAPELRVQVLQVEVRPLGAFSNDTVYLTRFAGPLWLEDCALTGVEEGRLQVGPWQLVEVHLSQVTALHASLVEEYPQIEFPKIDPLTKEMNVFTKSKKNTKMFEVQGYLFEEFFNFVLRNPTVMQSPMELVHRYKILPPFWQHLIHKNDYLSGRGEEARRHPQKYLYGEAHCNLCRTFLKAPLTELEKVRADFLHGNRNDHCFNAFCLMRMRLAALPESQFTTLEQMLLRQLLESGRMDYALLPREPLFKRYQEMTVMVGGESQKHMVLMDYRRKVGEVRIDLGYFLGLEDALDCRLILRYEGKERILDQDQVLFELISKYQLPAIEREDSNRQSRFSVNVTSMEKEEGFLSFISAVFRPALTSCLFFRKVIYLPKELQIKAIMQSPRRGKYLTAELFARLANGEIPLEPDDWAEACIVWLSLNSWSSLQSASLGELLRLSSDKLVPKGKLQTTKDSQFLKVFSDGVENLKKRAHLSLTEKEVSGVQRRCVRVFYRSERSYSYLASVTAHTVPSSVISDGLGPLLGECWVGVNFKEILVFRQFQDSVPAVKLSLAEVKVTRTTFSLFIDSSSYLGVAHEATELGESSATLIENDPKRTRLRFDARLLYHFSYLAEVYLHLRKIFPSVVV